MRLAFGGIHTECSTYGPHLQTVADFTVIEGEALTADLGIGLDAIPDVTPVPLFHARSVPGGPVDLDCYMQFKADFMARLKAALPLDGVLLLMHGAMFSNGLDDVEADWIEAVRDVVGQGCPISVSYDLHGNVTQRIIDAIDIFCAYRTAPHIDVKETYQRALAELLAVMRGGEKRMVGWVPVPVLWPGERTCTEDEPTRTLYEALPSYDAHDGVNDANLMVGYVWADTAKATASTVVTGTDKDAITKAAEEIAQGYWDNRDKFQFGVTTLALADCLDIIERTDTKPIILADSGDNPTGGGVGDRTDVLEAILDRNITGALFAGIADAHAALACAEAGVGNSLALNLEGGFGSICPRVSISVVVEKILGSVGDGDLEVLVAVAGNKLILTQKRRPFHNLEDFRKFGLEPEEQKLLVVKSGYLSPDLAPIASPPLMALTDGAVNQDVPALENKHRPRPSYPFQTDFDWKPKVRFSIRADGS